MPRNDCIILGIAADASLDEVKAAFRRRAMEVHPDTSGLESGPFLELQEAYGVLSDPERRRRYDHQLHPIVARQRPWDRRPHRFDSQKVLLDAFAEQVFVPLDFSRVAAMQAGANDDRAPLEASELLGE